MSSKWEQFGVTPKGQEESTSIKGEVGNPRDSINAIQSAHAGVAVLLKTVEPFKDKSGDNGEAMDLLHSVDASIGAHPLFQPAAPTVTASAAPGFGSSSKSEEDEIESPTETHKG